MPKVGDLAPPFTVTDSDGKLHSLAELTKSGQVVLAFFPKAFTSGCTRELTDYAKQGDLLKARQVHLLAVSGDDAETLRRFKAELKAPYIFIPDEKGQLMDAYGVRAWPLRIAKRTTFVIDDKGVVTRVDTGDDAIDVQNALGAVKSP